MFPHTECGSDIDDSQYTQRETPPELLPATRRRRVAKKRGNESSEYLALAGTANIFHETRPIMIKDNLV